MMIFLVLLCFVGVYFIASAHRNVRLIGFILSTVGSISWCFYGLYINDYNIVFQFIGYTLINLVGIKNNLTRSNEVKNDH